MKKTLSNAEQTFLGSILYYARENLSDKFDANYIDNIINVLIQRGITIPVIEKDK